MYVWELLIYVAYILSVRGKKLKASLISKKTKNKIIWNKVKIKSSVKLAKNTQFNKKASF